MSGPNPDNETYTVTIQPGTGTWRQLGLELVQDEALPGIRLALLFACLLGFTLSMDEIAVTYFLAGVQGTLPVYVWGLIRFGFSPEVNAAFSLIGGGLLLLILGTTAVVLVATRESRQSRHLQQEREQEGAAPATLEGGAAAS